MISSPQGSRWVSSYSSMRDYVVFTNKRVISVNVQGLTGKKKDFTSLPYSKVQAFSIETAGHIDLDSELQLVFSGLGTVVFEFTGASNIKENCATDCCQFVLMYIVDCLRKHAETVRIVYQCEIRYLPRALSG